ncbi:HTH-type transcriptional regulator XynR [Streptomyces sp. enrichment culture]|uniref:IclR family transcriptional regulator n=1 Tax=Streptomyces sp. enrichment culture TaxID=1795815 RepID=UPI003F56449F
MSGDSSALQQEEAAEAPDLTNKSVVKATVLLSELGRHRDGITVTDLAQAVGMTRPTAFRLLLSLEQTGFVVRTDNKYTLGWEIARLGRLADPYRGIVARVQPVLDEVAVDLKETVGYAVVAGETEFDLVAEASGSRLLAASEMYVGVRFPVHASATGKLLLAELSDERVEALLPAELPAVTPYTITDRVELLRALQETRLLGYATIDNEIEEGLFSLAVGVRSGEGRLIGVLTANGPTERMKSGRLPQVAERLRQAAVEIAQRLAPSAAL